MKYRVNQEIEKMGYFTESKYLYGNINDFETNLGFHYGRLRNGFFIAHLLAIPGLTDFELAGYSITPGHRFELPKEVDEKELKKIAREKMISIGSDDLVKVIPNTEHSYLMDDDEQYPYGRGGIPQWKLTKKLPMRIFMEVQAGHKGIIHL